MHVKVYPVVGGLVDIFVGDGWENWSRLFIAKNGTVTHMGGAKLARWVMKEVGHAYRQK